VAQIPHGFFDIGGRDAATRLAIADSFRGIAESFGFERFFPSPVGFESTFTDFGSETGERLFSFPDRKGRRLALTSDSLIVAARTAAHIAADNSRAMHLYGIVPIFRYRRAPYRNWSHLLLSVFNEAEGAVTDLMLPRALKAFLTVLRVPFVLDCCDYSILDAVLAARGFDRDAGRRALYNVRKEVTPGPAEEVVSALLVGGTPAAALELANGDAGVARQLAASADTMALLHECGVPTEQNWRFDHGAEHHSGLSFVIKGTAADGNAVDIGDGGGFHAAVNSSFPVLRTAWSMALSLDVMADLGMGAAVAVPTVVMIQKDASASFFFQACDRIRAAGVAVREHPASGADSGRLPRPKVWMTASAVCRVGRLEEETRSLRLIITGRPEAEFCFDVDGDWGPDLSGRLTAPLPARLQAGQACQQPAGGDDGVGELCRAARLNFQNERDGRAARQAQAQRFF
jgi:hypothetical protein